MRQMITGDTWFESSSFSQTPVFADSNSAGAALGLTSIVKFVIVYY